MPNKKTDRDYKEQQDNPQASTPPVAATDQPIAAVAKAQENVASVSAAKLPNEDVLYNHLTTINDRALKNFAALLFDKNISAILEGDQAKNSRENTVIQMHKMNEWANNMLQYFPSELADNYRKSLPDVTTKTGPTDNQKNLADLISLAIVLKQIVTNDEKLNKMVVYAATNSAQTPVATTPTVVAAGSGADLSKAALTQKEFQEKIKEIYKIADQGTRVEHFNSFVAEQSANMKNKDRFSSQMRSLFNEKHVADQAAPRFYAVFEKHLQQNNISDQAQLQQSMASKLPTILQDYMGFAQPNSIESLMMHDTYISILSGALDVNQPYKLKNLDEYMNSLITHLTPQNFRNQIQQEYMASKKQDKLFYAKNFVLEMEKAIEQSNQPLSTSIKHARNFHNLNIGFSLMHTLYSPIQEGETFGFWNWNTKQFIQTTRLGVADQLEIILNDRSSLSFDNKLSSLDEAIRLMGLYADYKDTDHSSESRFILNEKMSNFLINSLKNIREDLPLELKMGREKDWAETGWAVYDRVEKLEKNLESLQKTGKTNLIRAELDQIKASPVYKGVYDYLMSVKRDKQQQKQNEQQAQLNAAAEASQELHNRMLAASDKARRQAENNSERRASIVPQAKQPQPASVVVTNQQMAEPKPGAIQSKKSDVSSSAKTTPNPELSAYARGLLNQYQKLSGKTVTSEHHQYNAMKIVDTPPWEIRRQSGVTEVMIPSEEETARRVIESVIQNEKNRGKSTISIDMDDPRLIKLSQDVAQKHGLTSTLSELSKKTLIALDKEDSTTTIKFRK